MSSPINQLDDALGLVEVLSHLTTALANRGNNSDYLLRGMGLTVRQVEGVLQELRSGLKAAEPQGTRFAAKGNRGFQGSGDGNVTPRAARAGDSAPPPAAGHVRELNPHAQPAAGSFQRVVLPKEPPAPPGSDPLEH
jgi:hypothetical protein